MGKVEIGIYFCVTAGILTEVLLKCFWSYLSSTNHMNFVQITDYAPSFKEVDEAYWFRVVHASVRSSRTVRARVLKFHLWIPHGKIVNEHFFLVRVISLSGVML